VLIARNFIHAFFLCPNFNCGHEDKTSEPAGKYALTLTAAGIASRSLEKNRPAMQVGVSNRDISHFAQNATERSIGLQPALGE
jgi:hypothetical protein